MARGTRSPNAALRGFHPIVRRWFTETLGSPSDPQVRGWPAIASGDHTLILAPTGSGKTLAAFLWELNALITAGLEEPLPNALQLLYVSPLKALNNDIQRNLERPLAELAERFRQAGKSFPKIRVAVRTGDTPQSARARMLRTTPHILITTPESLHILLTSIRGRGMFSAVRVVIIDEIHALAGSKRGAHLALTLERLEHLCARPPQRIGLSATQRPLEEVARFLVGNRESGIGNRPAANDSQLQTPDCRIIDCGLVKRMHTRVISPADDLGDLDESVWPHIVPLVVEAIRGARTTLVFVNNRGLAERMTARLNAHAHEEIALPYHGSLSRERRLVLEERLKGGDLRALVSTSALELGIDIGSVDVVVQLQSPKRVAAGLQRVGRAGHTLDAVSRGVLIPTHLDDAMEMTAIVAAMGEGDVEPTVVPQNALDVLAQIIVAAVSVDEWTADDLFALVRRAYPYHRLTRAAFEEVLAMLAGKYPSEAAGELAPRLAWDRATGRLTGSRGSRITAVVSGGTIPDRGLYSVHLADRTRLGELDEEFVHESRVGDVFQLGSTTWRFTAIEHDRVTVAPAPGAPARMPFWHGEYMARSPHLTSRIATLRRDAAAIDPEDPAALETLGARYNADAGTIRSLARYVRAQRDITGIVPTDRELLLEYFRDEAGSVRLVLHAPFGGRVNAPWGMALAHRVREQIRGVDVQVQTTDDGIMLRLPDLGADPPLSAFIGMSADEARQRILEEVGGTSLFGARFRMNAARALLLPRSGARRRMPLWLQRLKALDLLETVREFPSFPILVETYRDVLQDAFDVPALMRVLDDLAQGRITVRTVVLERASPFSASLMFGFVMDWLYVDDTPRGERGRPTLSIDRALLDDLVGGEGVDADTEAALAQVLAVRRGTAPERRARTADELSHLFERAGDLTPSEVSDRTSPTAAGDPLAALLEDGRVIGVTLPTALGSEDRWILTEAYGRYRSAFGDAALARIRAGAALVDRAAADVVPASLLAAPVSADVARRELLSRYLMLSGPVSLGELRARYDLPDAWLTARLDDWTRTGKLIRGYYHGDRETVRWCSRRVLEHARRRALALARQAVQAVPMEKLAAMLQRWQHLDPRHPVDGPDATMAALEQLIGLARPAEGWERDYLPARVRQFDPAVLSRLAQSGEIIWVGGGKADDESGARPLTTIRFVDRGAAGLWIGHLPPDELPPASLSDSARRVYDELARLGASFFPDLQQATGLGTIVVRESLHELAAAGLVTNDTVEALRELLRVRPVLRRARNEPDPTRWLPADFEPSADRPIVQRRINRGRLPRWRRPDRPAATGRGWVGRWTLVRTPATLGELPPEEEHAEVIARQWLDRYGIVSRDWWRRERPPVSWRAIYRELRRLEFRGDVRRGYFVRGLAGAQFAMPAAVDMLREADEDPDAPVIVIAASDPANVWTLPVPEQARDADNPMDPVARPRGAGALLVMRRGRVLMSAEGHGRRVQVAANVPAEDVAAAATALTSALVGRGQATRRLRDLRIERIDGQNATASPYAAAFVAAGFRRDGLALRLDSPVS
jgi:ATP-dependent Lhr-like helicase